MVGIASRASGTVAVDGAVTIHKLLSFDIVADPGFTEAKMYLNLEQELREEERHQTRADRKSKLNKLGKIWENQ